MSTTEIIVLVGGLLLGYWLVSVLLPLLGRRTDAGDAPAPAPPRPLVDDAEFLRPRAQPSAWHDTLRLPPDADRDAIEAAYRRALDDAQAEMDAMRDADARAIAAQRIGMLDHAYRQALRERG